MLNYGKLFMEKDFCFLEIEKFAVGKVKSLINEKSVYNDKIVVQ